MSAILLDSIWIAYSHLVTWARYSDSFRKCFEKCQNKCQPVYFDLLFEKDPQTNQLVEQSPSTDGTTQR